MFLLDPHNQTVFQSHFQLWSFPIPLLKGIFIALVAAAAVPSTYFTYKYMQLLKHARRLEQERQAHGEDEKAIRQAAELLTHHMPEKALALLEPHDHLEALVLRGQAMLALERGDEAITLLKRPFFETGDLRAGYLLAEAYLSVDRSPVDTLQAITSAHAKEAGRAYHLLLGYYESQQAWQDCLDTLDRMSKVGIDPRPGVNPTAFRYGLIRQSETSRAPRKIIDQYQQLLKDDPLFVPAYLSLGDFLLETEAEEKAFAIYEKGFAKTENPAFLERLERYYLEQGYPEDAIQVYRQLLVKHGGQTVRFQLAKLYYKLQMLDESLELLEGLRGRLGHLPGYLFILGDIKARRAHHDEALDAFKSLARELGFSGADFICTHCGSRYESYQGRCDSCGRWNTVTLETETVTTETTVASSPIYYGP
ncbi:hypothetical protein [Sulfidibacter corallicola]|uniref:LapB rubredoxin metal binding domain-containing protein n=1 Tax=Sulfidibacter corallicola TaxID=2818388 RepID=A0A8A4U3D6_SULCO|nr:hypothetical protein [Sulfidibacter corallicola]QTD53255.1 hypothetical protein J3U87_12440 [Sulfidibacter corallicola]